MNSNTAEAILTPGEIERRGFEIIREELNKRRGAKGFTQGAAISVPGKPMAAERTPLEEEILMRVIHTTADFDYDDNLVFIHNAAAEGVRLLHNGIMVVTDTQMTLAGINKKVLAKYGGEALCFMSDADVAAMAETNGVTRAQASIDKAASLSRPLIFAAGNAPTALMRIHDLVLLKVLTPSLIIGVPVGFVNVEASKELFLDSSIPCIIARGRKGGSTVAAAIVNAMLYYNQQPRREAIPDPQNMRA